MIMKKFILAVMICSLFCVFFSQRTFAWDENGDCHAAHERCASTGTRSACNDCDKYCKGGRSCPAPRDNHKN